MTKTVINGGKLSFTQAAELYEKEKPIYKLSTEPSSKWAISYAKEQLMRRDKK